MHKFFLVAAILGVLGAPAIAQEGYTYGDLMTGEEIRATKETLDSTIMTRLQEQAEVSYQLAVIAQVIGDGILCDLLMTRHVLDANPNMSLSDAAQAAQTTCLTEGLRLQQSMQNQ